MVLLRELFQKNLKQQKKNYYKLNTTGKYIINHKKMYYLTCNTEDEAKKGVELLKEVNWDRSEIPRIKEELGIVRQINTNKTGFLNTYIEPHNHLKKGYRYVYKINKDGNLIRLSSMSLKQLKKNVKDKNLQWKPLTEDAKKIDEYL